MGSGRRIAVGAVVAAGLLLGAPAGAQTTGDVSAAELRALAARASSSAVALEQLRSVRRVGGVPVHMDVVLGHESGAGLRSRLALLAATPDAPGPAPDAHATGRDAARILDQARFKPPAQPRPLRGFFRWLGARLQPLLRPLRPLGRPVAAVWRNLTDGGPDGFVVGALIAVVAVLASLRLIRRRGRRLAVGGGRRRDRTRGLDPDQLERDAAAAERAGRFEEAIHLRFLAGLVRLDRAGAIELRPSLTSGALRRRVPSPALRDLTVTFEEIVYGGRPAIAEDVDQARRDWPRALEEVGR
ncbi:MAG: hypothetical protein QOJ09_192 [Actinomycetota bacterium]|nr:hypothetical protein [Actinomycetota bacterium]